MFRLLGVPFLQAESLYFLLFVKSTPCGWVGPVACQVFLVGQNCVCVLVGGARSLSFFFFLECNEVSNSVFWGVYEFGMALGSLSFNVLHCVPVLLEN